MERFTVAWTSFVLDLLPYVVLVPVAMSLLTFILCLYVLRRVWRVTAGHRRLDRKLKEAGLEELLLEQEKVLERVGGDLAELSRHQEALRAAVGCCLQRTGLVRFNAFPDTGGELSFALAVLDGGGNGLVLSSLYGRNDSRVYAKAVTRGRSPDALSEEEKEAIRRAMNP